MFSILLAAIFGVISYSRPGGWGAGGGGGVVNSGWFGCRCATGSLEPLAYLD